MQNLPHARGQRDDGQASLLGPELESSRESQLRLAFRLAAKRNQHVVPI